MFLRISTLITLIFELVTVSQTLGHADCCNSSLNSNNSWIIIMQRMDGSVNFDRTWTCYRNGFGDHRQCNFWIGLEKMSQITNEPGTAYELRIEVQAFNSSVLYYANYEQFVVGSENTNYTLNVNGYSGNAGDTFTSTSLGSNWYLNGKQFSTPDRDNDIGSETHCARKYSSGWWFGNCWQSLLTGPYGTDNFSWYTLHDAGLEQKGKLRSCRMMIRRTC